MSSHTTAALAEQRRQQLLAEVTSYRHARAVRAQRAHRPSPRPTRRRTVPRPMVAFQTWLAAGQL
jgi:hypothetical protein